MKRIVLASSSPRRQQLLSQIGLDFSVVPSLVEESTVMGEDPVQVAQGLALSKAREVASRVGDSLVIGADTVVVLGDEILGKPGSPREAELMLAKLQGRWHVVVTGVAVVDGSSGEFEVGHECTRVHVRQLGEDEIAFYVSTGEPLDKAGAYGIQGLGALLVDRIEGCYHNVVGLPLARLCKILERFGVKLLIGEGRRTSG
ncbi:MAG: Maf family protein [Bacillota bacterium]